MSRSNPGEPLYEADADLKAEILAFFSSDTAAAIRQYTCAALAKDFNLPSAALEEIMANTAPASNRKLGVRFFSRHLHQFAWTPYFYRRWNDD